MTHEERLARDAMVFAINHDFFGYGSTCKRVGTSTYLSIVDEEKTYYSGMKLAKEFKKLKKSLQKDIFVEFYENTGVSI